MGIPSEAYKICLGRVEVLADKDSNLDKQIQNLLCYRYTIRQEIERNFTMPLSAQTDRPQSMQVSSLASIPSAVALDFLPRAAH